MYRVPYCLVLEHLVYGWLGIYQGRSRQQCICCKVCQYFHDPQPFDTACLPCGVVQLLLNLEHLRPALYNCKTVVAVDTLNVLWNPIKCLLNRLAKVYKPFQDLLLKGWIPEQLV